MEISETIGKMNAYLIANGFPIEYHDVAIAATFLRERENWLLTENKKHFTMIPGMEKVAITPIEFNKKFFKMIAFRNIIL